MSYVTNKLPDMFARDTCVTQREIQRRDSFVFLILGGTRGYGSPSVGV